MPSFLQLPGDIATEAALHSLFSFVDFEWIVIAMAFIAFVRWIIEQATGKGERSGDGEHEVVVDEAGDDVPWRGEEVSRRSLERDTPTSQGGSASSEIRRFLEALGGESVEPPPPIEPATDVEAPPPLPANERAPKSIAALEPYPGRGKVGAKELTPYSVDLSQARGRAVLRGDLQELVARPIGLKLGVVLREVLGPPRGLQ